MSTKAAESDSTDFKLNMSDAQRAVLRGVSLGGSSTPGKGTNAAEQGIQTVRATYDRKTVQSIRTSGQNKNHIFPIPPDEKVHDALEQEFAFAYKMKRSELTEDKNSVAIMTSLNGLGSDIVAAYPHDEEMQKLCLQNRIRYAGIVKDNLHYSSERRKQGVALQIAGVSTHYAENDMPPGTLAQLVIPSPKKVKTQDRVSRPHIHSSKALLEVVPYNPTNIELKLAAALRHYAQDPDMFVKAMGPKFRTTHAWVNMAECLFQTGFACWALFQDAIQNIGVVENLRFGPNDEYDLNLDKGSPVEGQSVINAIGVATGLLQRADSTGRDIQGVEITPEHKELYERLAAELKLRLFHCGGVANFLYGYDPNTRSNEGIDEHNGKIKINTPVGNMIHIQINHAKQLTSALADAVNRDREWIVGKTTKGAQATGRFDITK